MLDKNFVPQFNITLNCNMYKICGYCYVKDQKGSFPLNMDCEAFEKILEWLIALDVDEIILLGGEPTLHPSFEEILTISGRHNVSVRLFTNGTYNSETADLISRCDSINPSFFIMMRIA